MADERLKSKSSGKTWDTPEAFYADALAAAPTPEARQQYESAGAQGLWDAMKANPKFAVETIEKPSYVSEVVSNLPGSIGRAMVGSVVGPIKLAGGAAAAIKESVSQSSPTPTFQFLGDTASNLIDNYKGYYGDLGENFKKDPARLIGDVAIVAGGAGAAARKAGANKLGKVATAVEAGANALTNPIAAVDNTLHAMSGTAPAKKAAESLMEHQLKLNKNISRQAGKSYAKEALESEIPLTEKGLKHLEDTIMTDVRNRMVAFESDPAKAQLPIDASDIEAAGMSAAEGFADPSLKKSAAKKVGEYREEYWDNQPLTQERGIDLKRKMNQQDQIARQNQVTSNDQASAGVEVQKQMLKELRGKIRENVNDPAYNELSKREHRLIEVRDSLDDILRSDRNQSFWQKVSPSAMGGTILSAGGIGSVLAGGNVTSSIVTTAALGVLAKMLMSRGNLSKLAISMYKRNPSILRQHIYTIQQAISRGAKTAPPATAEPPQSDVNPFQKDDQKDVNPFPKQ